MTLARIYDAETGFGQNRESRNWRGTEFKGLGITGASPPPM